MNDQLAEWRGHFGDEYTERKVVSDDLLHASERCWRQILDQMQPLGSILEVGARSCRRSRGLVGSAVLGERA